MSLTKVRDIDVTIVVPAGGAAHYTFPGSGVISFISIQPPSAGATYDIEVIKYSGYGIYGNPTLTGYQTMIVNRNFTEKNSLYVENATPGSYKCLISISSGI